MIQELYVFLSATGSGMATGFLYDLFRLKRKALKTKAFAVSIEDTVFWLLATLLVFITAYASNQGEIRLYFFFAVIVGVIIYYWLFSKWVIQILTFIAKVILWPISVLIKLLKPPTKWLGKQFSKGTIKTKKQLNIAGIKFNRRLKSMHHIAKKL